MALQRLFVANLIFLLRFLPASLLGPSKGQFIDAPTSLTTSQFNKAMTDSQYQYTCVQSNAQACTLDDPLPQAGAVTGTVTGYSVNDLIVAGKINISTAGNIITPTARSIR
jgi:hypothetical protein